MAAAWTRGVQSTGVIGNVKHYAVNNQEGQGVTAPGAPIGVGVVGSRMVVDARVSERTVREMYLPAFEAAVNEGDVGSVMCAYNRQNSPEVLPFDERRLRGLAVIGPEADELRDGGGSSAIDEFRTTSPLEALRARLGADRMVYEDGSDAVRAAEVAAASDAAVVVVGDRMTEGKDKSAPTLNADQTDGIDRGALARVLLGDLDPGGRLPATFPRSADDLPTAGDPEAYPGVGGRAHYKEGVLVGYRHFDVNGIPPAFPFGHGLSYTTFRYGTPTVRPATGDQVATVSFSVGNIGDVTGYAVPQLYVGMPRPRPGVVQPPRQLKGAAKLLLVPGEPVRHAVTGPAVAVVLGHRGGRMARHRRLLPADARQLLSRHPAPCGTRMACRLGPRRRTRSLMRRASVLGIRPAHRRWARAAIHQPAIAQTIVKTA